MRVPTPIFLQAGLLLACTSLMACVPSKPPEEERRPEPQAGQHPDHKSAIVQTADAYKDRARSAEESQLDAADQQRAAIDAQTQ
ncbi:MAG: hypothetical protein ABIQ62_03430 [Thermomonas sp.]